MLNQLTPAELGRLANSLPGDLANNKTREAATVIISAMAENPATFNQINIAQLRQILSSFKTHLGNYLASGNYEMVDRIFKVLKECSEIDAFKADVADIASMLINHGTFCHYLNEEASNPRLGNIFEISTSCSQTQNVETRRKILDVIERVLINTGPIQSRKAIKLTDQATNQIAPKIEQIIEMLEESSAVDETKQYVASIIDLLGKWGFFQAMPHDQNSRLINALSNCLIYDGEPISSHIDTDDEQDRTVIILNQMLFRSEWMASFIKGLSPEDAARLYNVADEALRAGEMIHGGP